MKKEEIRKQVKFLMGNTLLPDDTEIGTLKLELPDLLIFKEEIDMEFGDIFDVKKITSFDTIGTLADYVVETVSTQRKGKEKTLSKTKSLVPDSIGFLIQDLAANYTVPIRWKELPEGVKKIFTDVVNAGIDKEKAEISHKKELYIFSYRDSESDFSASYIVYDEELIFSYEN